MLDGLCVCVALGNVWKESLTELSGGQRYAAAPGYIEFGRDLMPAVSAWTDLCGTCRSLLALSLVLSLLLFKPAPMYILDEVTLTPA